MSIRYTKSGLVIVPVFGYLGFYQGIYPTDIDASLKGLEAVLSQLGMMVNPRSLCMQAVIIALRKIYEKLRLHQIRTDGIEVGHNRNSLGLPAWIKICCL